MAASRPTSPLRSMIGEDYFRKGGAPTSVGLVILRRSKMKKIVTYDKVSRGVAPFSADQS